MKDLLWLYPVLLRVPTTPSELAQSLGVPSSKAKSFLHYAKKFGLVEKEGESFVLTKKGKAMLDAYELVKVDGRKVYVKGEDGCFLIIVKRKRGIKTVRVPCSEASRPESPPEEGPRSRRA